MVVNADKPLPFKDNEFDMVVAFHLLMYIKDIRAFMREVHRILKPGGVFKCSIDHSSKPNLWRDPARVRSGHSEMFYQWTDIDDNASMQQWTNGVKFALADFDFSMRCGRVLKPLVRRSFKFYEHWLAGKLLYIDSVTFVLRKRVK